MSSVMVLKLGGSILEGPEDLAAASLEVYREVRAGHRVVAVVSAFRGRTDALTELACRLCPGSFTRSHCALLAIGEAEATAALALQLDGDGVPAACIGIHRLGLHTRGDLADAEPVAVNREALTSALDKVPVVVVPGFAGVDEHGEPTLLGRGGSDLTAIFLAQELGARCRLVKDVDGWFEHDPSLPGAPPSRWTRLSWDDALADGAPVVQPKAVALARGRSQEFAVGALGTARPTLVGAGPTLMELAAAPLPPLRVSLLGLGTVGGGVYERLTEQPDRYRVVSVLTRDADKERDVDFDPALMTVDPDAALSTECDVVVEMVGGAGDARRYVLEALRRGRHVVSANKLLLAEHGLELERAAAAAGVRLIGSAAVGGAVPMLETVARLARFPGVRRFRGVLNGTTNFVLDRLADGLDFDQAVAKAQELGFAEADPSADLSGADAAAKAVLLGRVATGLPLTMQDVHVHGIDGPEVRTARPVAGERLRLVARGTFSDDGSVQLAIQPEWVSSDDPLGRVRDEENILIVTAADGSEVAVEGRGAGRRPTALAVMADLEEIRLARALEDRALEEQVAEGVG